MLIIVSGLRLKIKWRLYNQICISPKFLHRRRSEQEHGGDKLALQSPDQRERGLRTRSSGKRLKSRSMDQNSATPRSRQQAAIRASCTNAP